MKHPTIYHGIRFFLAGLFIVAFELVTKAQDKVVVDEQQIGSWFERNWMWVVGGVVLLILILLLSGGRKTRQKTTTVVKDDFGNVRSVSTEIKES